MDTEIDSQDTNTPLYNLEIDSDFQDQCSFLSSCVTYNKI